MARDIDNFALVMCLHSNVRKTKEESKITWNCEFNIKC